jgi:hypothetical protein
MQRSGSQRSTAPAQSAISVEAFVSEHNQLDADVALETAKIVLTRRSILKATDQKLRDLLNILQQEPITGVGARDKMRNHLLQLLGLPTVADDVQSNGSGDDEEEEEEETQAPTGQQPQGQSQQPANDHRIAALEGSVARILEQLQRIGPVNPAQPPAPYSQPRVPDPTSPPPGLMAALAPSGNALFGAMDPLYQPVPSTTLPGPLPDPDISAHYSQPKNGRRPDPPKSSIGGMQGRRIYENIRASFPNASTWAHNHRWKDLRNHREALTLSYAIDRLLEAGVDFSNLGMESLLRRVSAVWLAGKHNNWQFASHWELFPFADAPLLDVDQLTTLSKAAKNYFAATRRPNNIPPNNMGTPGNNPTNNPPSNQGGGWRRGGRGGGGSGFQNSNNLHPNNNNNNGNGNSQRGAQHQQQEPTGN